MNLPIPTNDKLKLKLPPLHALPAMFEPMLPMPVPQLPYKPGIAGIIEGFFHNVALKQQNTAAESEANIAENKLRQTKAQFEQIKELLLFGHKYNLDMVRINHEQEMLSIEKRSAEAALTEQQLKNYLTQIEAEKAQLELQQMKKELGLSADKENGE